MNDPLFTVPIHDPRVLAQGLAAPSICFEVHGAAGKILNFISDLCTSVNAAYRSLVGPTRGNFVSRLGVKAVDLSGACVGIEVGVASGCSPSVTLGNGTVLGGLSRYDSSGVSVRKVGSKVRVSVPNCEKTRLVMWAECTRFAEQDVLKFSVTRGVNLRPTSHGIIGARPIVVTHFVWCFLSMCTHLHKY